MAAAHELLRAAGIWLPPDKGPAALRAESARLVRRMRERLVYSIGLVPAADDVAVPGVAIEVGRALADHSAGTVAIVDAHGSWPSARPIVEGAAPDGTLVVTSWLVDNLALLTPRIFEAGAMLGQLDGVVREMGSTFNHLVIDLTGFDHLGEQLAAYELVEAVVVVARNRRTTARQIQRRLHELPEGRGLGVLLTGV